MFSLEVRREREASEKNQRENTPKNVQKKKIVLQMIWKESSWLCLEQPSVRKCTSGMQVVPQRDYSRDIILG